MEGLDWESVASMLKRELRFFVGIERSEFQRLTDSLELLDSFLKDSDEDSAEEVMRESVNSWFEETKDEPQVNGVVEDDCVLKLSRLLQEPRIIDFLSRAGQRFRRMKSSWNIFFDSENESSEALSVNYDPTPLISTHDMFFDTDSENSAEYLVDDTAWFESSRNQFLEYETEINEASSFENEETEQTREEDDASKTDIVERHSLKIFYSFLEEYVDSTVKHVMELLIDGPPKRSVISLVGPNGIGKTILARKVYDDEIVRDLFDCCGWIDVSSSYDVKEILKSMIKQISVEERHDIKGLDGMRTMELLSILRQSLQPKRYMFVFDDVCREEFWHFVKQGLPDNEKGSRIIVATPADTFVDSCKACSFDHVYCLGPLSDSMSWYLFCRTAFQDESDQQVCPSELEDLSLEIIRMCKGFPLPIVAVAGLLSTKENKVSEWEKLHHNFIIEFKFNLRPPSALEVLALSFLDLPNHLRACFLYFSIFPEQCLIPVDKLFQLWIAEGFVEEKIGTTLEEIAEEYLNELVRRNMVQVYPRFQGFEKFCQVHALIHHMARVKAHELNFCLVQDENNSSFRKNSLRLSIHNVSNAWVMFENSMVRSVFLFNISSLLSSFVVDLNKRCELLTLLDLENVPIEDLPEELGNFSHLKYLSLKNTKVKKLPKSLARLQDLQTLDLRNTLMIELPLEINELRNLQHLLAGVSTRGMRIREGIGMLEKLHTLMTVDVRLGGVGLFKELAKLRKLRRLGISGLTAEVGIALCTAIDELIHLETLTLQAKSDEVLKLQTISTMLTHLKCLVLKGQLQKFPYLIVGLPNLTTLCLSLSRLTKSPLEDLYDLPNLASLWLYRAYDGYQLYFAKGGFRRLELLVLTELQGLNVVEIEEGALPSLEELRIGSSPLLNEVPSGIEHLRNLKVLGNYDMPSEFVLSIQPYCSDYWKIEHIPTVIFWYRVEGRSYKMYKLGDSELLDHFLGLEAKKDVIVQRPYELESSFCDSDEEEDEDDDVDQLSYASSRSFVRRSDANQWSFSSGFYTDDVEE